MLDFYAVVRVLPHRDTKRFEVVGKTGVVVGRTHQVVHDGGGAVRESRSRGLRRCAGLRPDVIRPVGPSQSGEDRHGSGWAVRAVVRGACECAVAAGPFDVLREYARDHPRGSSDLSLIGFGEGRMASASITQRQIFHSLCASPCKITSCARS